MRNPQFRKVIPNYRKNVLEITLKQERRLADYQLPFSVFEGHQISSKNRFKKIEIDSELNNQGVFYELENGQKGSFPADLVLYYFDPAYDWSPLNQIKRALKTKLDDSGLSVRVIADAIQTSPSQVMRLFEDNKGSKQLAQLFRLADMAGYEIEIKLKKRKKRA